MIAASHSQLFKIETNKDFSWDKSLLESECVFIREAAASFGLPEFEQLERMKKRNGETRVYRYETLVGDFILRAAPKKYAALLEEQCRLASELSSPTLIQPVQSRLKTFTVETKNDVWMLYAFESANILSGHESYEQVFSACVQLLEEMKHLKPRGLFSVFHKTRAWKQTAPLLWDPAARAVLSEFVSPETLALVDGQKDWLLGRFQQMADFKRSSAALTHNDLNHANILMGCDGVKIVDLEDLCYEDPNIALAHCFFKVIRHGVFQGCLTAEKGREVLKKALAHAGFRGFQAGDLQSFSHYALFRMVSEIHNLLARVFIQKDPNKPKDLEKKILNLFELERLVQAA